MASASRRRSAAARPASSRNWLIGSLERFEGGAGFRFGGGVGAITGAVGGVVTGVTGSDRLTSLISGGTGRRDSSSIGGKSGGTGRDSARVTGRDGLTGRPGGVALGGFWGGPVTATGVLWSRIGGTALATGNDLRVLSAAAGATTGDSAGFATGAIAGGVALTVFAAGSTGSTGLTIFATGSAAGVGLTIFGASFSRNGFAIRSGAGGRTLAGWVTGDGTSTVGGAGSSAPDNADSGSGIKVTLAADSFTATGLGIVGGSGSGVWATGVAGSTALGMLTVGSGTGTGTGTGSVRAG